MSPKPSKLKHLLNHICRILCNDHDVVVNVFFYIEKYEIEDDLFLR